MDEKLLWYVGGINRSFNGDSIDAILNLYRVIRIRDDGKASRHDPERLYIYAQDVNCSRKYKGDITSLMRMCDLLYKLDTHECFEYIDYMLGLDRRAGVPVMPTALSSVMFNKIGGGEKSIFVPDCDKFGVALYEAVHRYPSAKFYTTCSNDELVEVYKYLYRDLNVEFIPADIYKEDFTNIRFDVVFSFPVMGGRDIFNKGDFISRDPALIATQNLLYHLSMEGKLVIVLPAKVGFASGDIEDFRKYIENHYKIEEIASLPNKTFAPYMAINTLLLTISVGQTDDIHIIKYDFEKNQDKKGDAVSSLKVADEKLLFLDELEELNGWNVDLAFSQDDEEVATYKNSSIKKNFIKDVAKVFRGKAITSRSENGNIAVINISNIYDLGIDYDELETISDDLDKVDRYLLQDGDVLVTSRGTTVKIGVFKSFGKPCIASSNINVIRPTKAILGTYLKLFLDSDVGQKMLKSLQRGATIVNINYQDIETIEVPVPLMIEQQEIVSKYEEGLSIYKKTIEAADYGWKSLLADLKSKLY